MLVNKGITEKIIGCAYTVYNRLGYGFLESVYEKSLMHELKKAGIKVESQVPIQVWYDDVLVGNFDADLLVDDVIIVELKSIQRLVQAHEVQLVNYLTATQKETGLLINFGPRRVEVKRKFRDYKQNNPVNPVNPVEKKDKNLDRINRMDRIVNNE